MPQNRQALIRYRTIDACLRRSGREWTIQDLIDACSQALANTTGNIKPISKRTIQRDIEDLRKNWGAPIEVADQKYYHYTDLNFSLERVPLTEDDAYILLEIREILHSFQEFDQIRELDHIIKKIEKSLQTHLSWPAGRIQFDHAAIAFGRIHLPLIYRAIVDTFALDVSYQSFRQTDPESFPFSPYLIKAYNSRWYILGYHHLRQQISILALDRLHAIGQSKTSYHPPAGIDLTRYFSNRMGVSAPSDAQPEYIELWVSPAQAPYVKSRPWHPSQHILSEDASGLLISLRLIPNYELTSHILSFGAGVAVRTPPTLAATIASSLKATLAYYDEKCPKADVQSNDPTTVSSTSSTSA